MSKLEDYEHEKKTADCSRDGNRVPGHISDFGCRSDKLLSGKQKQEAVFQALEHIAEQETGSTSDKVDSSEEVRGPENSEYDTLSERNPDFWGWIKIDGTQLSYPVMYTPDDPEHYLRRDFDGNDSTCGVPFLDGACSVDCGNYIIYGHHMKDGTMFGSLLSYAKKDYWESHPTIQLSTSQGQSTYTILAAFYAKVYNQEDTDVF